MLQPIFSLCVASIYCLFCCTQYCHWFFLYAAPIDFSYILHPSMLSMLHPIFIHTLCLDVVSIHSSRMLHPSSLCLSQPFILHIVAYYLYVAPLILPLCCVHLFSQLGCTQSCHWFFLYVAPNIFFDFPYMLHQYFHWFSLYVESNIFIDFSYMSNPIFSLIFPICCTQYCHRFSLYVAPNIVIDFPYMLHPILSLIFPICRIQYFHWFSLYVAPNIVIDFPNMLYAILSLIFPTCCVHSFFQLCCIQYSLYIFLTECLIRKETVWSRQQNSGEWWQV